MSGVSGTGTPARTLVGGVEGMVMFEASSQWEQKLKESLGEAAEVEPELEQGTDCPFIFIFHIAYTGADVQMDGAIHQCLVQFSSL